MAHVTTWKEINTCNTANGHDDDIGGCQGKRINLQKARDKNTRLLK